MGRGLSDLVEAFECEHFGTDFGDGNEIECGDGRMEGIQKDSWVVDC